MSQHRIQTEQETLDLNAGLLESELGGLHVDLTKLAGKDHWLIAFLWNPSKSKFILLSMGMMHHGGLDLPILHIWDKTHYNTGERFNAYRQRVRQEIDYLRSMGRKPDCIVPDGCAYMM